MTGPRTRFLAALATVIGLVAGGFTAHLAPQGDGFWHGVTGVPSPTRIALSIAAGLLIWILGRVASVRPLLLMIMGLLPFVPAMTGMGSGLLFFSNFTMVLLFAILVVTCARDLLPRLPTLGAPSVFLISLGFFVFVGRFIPGAAGPQGDEPHYLLIAESLIEDGDVDLKNQFDERAFSKFTSANLEPHTAPRTPAGTMYAIHTPGLSALIAPGYAVGGYAGARFVLSALMAVVVTLLFVTARILFGADTACFAFLLATFASPLPIYANSLFPDSAATLAVAATLAFLAAARTPLLALSCTSIAALPWLHPRFLPLAGLLALAISMRDGLSLKRGISVFAPLITSLAVLLLHFRTVFGSASLSAAYGPNFSSDVSLMRIPWGASALLLDRQFGLLLFAPVLLLGLAGVSELWKRRKDSALASVGAIAILISIGGAFSMWWGGASAPGRFLIGAMPAFLIFAAARWKSDEGGMDQRIALSAAAGFGLGLVWLSCLAPRALHNRNDGESGLLRLLTPVLDGDRFFAGFVTGSHVWLAALWAITLVALAWRPKLGASLALLPFLASTATARSPLLDPFPATLRILESWNDHRRAFGGVESSDAFHLDVPLGPGPWLLTPGTQFYSPRFSLPAGSWTLRVESQGEATPDAVNVARVNVFADDESEPLATALVEADKTGATSSLVLGRDERRLRLRADGIQSKARIRSVRLIPIVLEH